MSAMMQVNDVNIRLGSRWVCRNVAFSIQAGDMIGLIGPNGAGKTTLIRAMTGLLKPTSGTITFEGENLFALPERERARAISFMAQNPEIGFGFPVYDVVMMGRYPFLPSWRAPTAADHLAVEQAMQYTGISRFSERRITELSGGERQRVFLARALAQQPRLLFLDEPTANLDISYQLDMLQAIRTMNRAGLTVVLAIHDLTWALRFCHKLLLLREGEIIGFGPPDDVLQPERVTAAFGVHSRILTGIDGQPYVDVAATAHSEPSMCANVR